MKMRGKSENKNSLDWPGVSSQLISSEGLTICIVVRFFIGVVASFDFKNVSFPLRNSILKRTEINEYDETTLSKLGILDELYSNHKREI